MIDLTTVKHIYVACGYTDLRKGIDGYIFLADSNLKITHLTMLFLYFVISLKTRSKYYIMKLDHSGYITKEWSDIKLTGP